MRSFKNRKRCKRFVGSRLRDCLLKHNYTYQAFADEIGITAAYVSGIVNGQTDPSVEILYAFAAKLGVSTDWLLGLTDYPYRSM